MRHASITVNRQHYNGLLVEAEKRSNIQKMNNIADSVKYTVNHSLESAENVMQKLYMNRDINAFYKQKYDSTLDYYNNYIEFMKNFAGSDKYSITLYVDNESIVNGGYCKKIETIQNQSWYQQVAKGKEIICYSDYSKINWETKRQIYFVRKLDYYGKSSGNNFLKVDMNYSELQRTVMNLMHSNIVYVCAGDKIILSNEGKGGLYDPFETIKEKQIKKAGAHKILNVYESEWDIYVMPEKTQTFEVIREHGLLLLLLIGINIFLPAVFMSLINSSFTERLRKLETVLENTDMEQLTELTQVSGTDEISSLMNSYNRMAARINHLIQNEYKYRIKKQESDIARQKAELLALHSQINPHFLFNALESIRMHSILKNENETSEMVERLALMTRQNVEWGNDAVKLEDELRFVEAYLELQKYRFGEKLKYKIEKSKECDGVMLPKLTLVTFVENACVHGMEKKSLSSWIFIRIYKREKELVLEVEDTGDGMMDEKCAKLEYAMNHVEIGMLQEKSRVGMLNAALRLKMYFGEQVTFEIESEKGTGTLITITIP